MTKTRPIRDQVLVRLDPEEETTSGGIVIPQTAKKRTYTGVVLAKGEGSVTGRGVRIPVDVDEGDRVFFSEYAGEEHPELQNDRGVRHVIIRETEICGVIT